jgi:hypothetical protein
VSTDVGETWTSSYPDTNDAWSSPWPSAPVLTFGARTDSTLATIYAGGVHDQHVCWIREDGQGACARLNQHFEGPTVLVVDPRNPHVVFAGTNGFGVYRSTDAGVTWGGGGAGDVRALVVDPLTTNTLYAGSTDLGILKSADGGITWTPLNGGLEPTVRALAIVAPAILYAATSAGVFKSTDGGVSWNPTGMMQRLQSLSIPSRLIGGNSANGSVTLTTPAPAGGTRVKLSSGNPALAAVPPEVTVPAGEISAPFAIATMPVTELAVMAISATLDGFRQSAELTIAPPITALMLTRFFITGGMTVDAMVSLGLPAPAGGAIVAITSSDPGLAAVPASVTVPEGTTAIGFPISTVGVSGDAYVTIGAAYGGGTRSLVVRIATVAVSSLSLNPEKVFAGSTSTGTVTLVSPAPATGTIVTLVSDNTNVATVPASITVPAGATSASFTVSTKSTLPAGFSQVSFLISARAGGIFRDRALLVVLPDVRLSALTVNPTSISGGVGAIGTVSLSAAAPAGGAMVALSSSDASVASVPGSVTVPAGATSASFTVATLACASGSATLSGSYSAVTQSAVLEIISNPDNITIDQAAYYPGRRELRVTARSTHSGTTLRAYVTSSGALIGTLRNLGDGRYSGEFSRSTYPQQITVRSTSCGSATASVSNR